MGERIDEIFFKKKILTTSSGNLPFLVLSFVHWQDFCYFIGGILREDKNGVDCCFLRCQASSCVRTTWSFDFIKLILKQFGLSSQDPQP